MRLLTIISLSLSLLVGCAVEDPSPDVNLNGSDTVNIDRLEEELQELIYRAEEAEERLAELEATQGWSWVSETSVCSVDGVILDLTGVDVDVTSVSAWTCQTNDDGLTTCSKITSGIAWQERDGEQWLDIPCFEGVDTKITYRTRIGS